MPTPTKVEVSDHGNEGTVTVSTYPEHLPTAAVEQICTTHSPTAFNLLHLLTRRKDPTVQTVYGAEHCASQCQTLSAEPYRRLAREALARESLSPRGEPAYDPTLFQQASAWKRSQPASLPIAPSMGHLRP